MMNDYLVRIFTSESFLAFVGTLLVMGILYLIVRYFTYRSGVNDLLKKADKRQILENLKNYPMDQFSMLRDGSMPEHTPFNRE